MRALLFTGGFEMSKERKTIVPEFTSPGPVLLKAEPEPLLVDLKRMAVLVIDMQNAFVSKDGMLSSRGVDISMFKGTIETIAKVNSAARARGVKIVYTAHRLSPDLREIGGPGLPYWHKSEHMRKQRELPDMRDRLIIRGTWGADIVKELEPQAGDIIIEKPKFSAFYETNLDMILRTASIKYLVFMGMATNIGIEASIKDAFHRGYFCTLVSDATSAIGPPFLQDATISNVKLAFGWVTTSENVIEAMQQKP